MRKVQELGPLSGGGFDLAAALKGVPDLNTGEEQIVRLPLDAIDPDPDNFYSLEGLDELAGNIETVGLLDPIRVRPNGERYTVVSGHRRRAACLLIRDGGNQMFDSGVPCIVEYGEASDAMRRLRLIYANSCTRERSDAEKRREIEETRKALYELQAQGVQFTGRMRDHVAEAVNLTKSKIGRLDAIGHNLIPELLALFDKGVLNESTAYELQKLPKNVQIYLAGKKKIQEGNITGDAAKICVDNCEKYLHPGCICPDGSDCTHTVPRFYETLTQRWAYCRGGCCLECRYTESECPYQCKESKKKTEERRAKDRDDKAKAEKKQKTERDRNREQLAEQYKALVPLVKAAGLKRTDIINISGAYTVADLEDKAENPERIGDYDARTPRVFTDYSYVKNVCSFADQLGVSVDYLLGRTEAVRPAACHSEPVTDVTGVGIRIPDGEEGERIATSPSAPRNDSGEEDAAPEPRWLTGTPPRPGRYFCRMKGSHDPEDEPPKEFRFDWDGETWYFTGRPIMKSLLVVGWWPLPEVEG